MARTIRFTICGFSLIVLLVAARPVNAVSLKTSARLTSRFMPDFIARKSAGGASKATEIIPCFSAAILGSLPGRLMYSTSLSGLILLSSQQGFGAGGSRSAEGDSDLLSLQIGDVINIRRYDHRKRRTTHLLGQKHDVVTFPYRRHLWPHGKNKMNLVGEQRLHRG